jgi:leucyl aminopeptidase
MHGGFASNHSFWCWITKRRPAGSITAGAFLAAFVGDYPFVHLDIAGTAWVDRPAKLYDSHGGTGVGVRLLTEFLRQYSP